jgi:hypothetical protein
MVPLDRVMKLLNTLNALQIDWKGVKYADMVVFGEKYFACPKVVVVGTNPSNKSTTTMPFDKSTKSGETVRSWFDGYLYGIAYRNLYNNYTKDNKLPQKSDCQESIRRLKEYREKGYKIVACGSFVSKLLTESNISHFSIPHPSGLCRFWNDKEAGEAKIKEMHNWIQNGTQN